MHRLLDSQILMNVFDKIVNNLKQEYKTAGPFYLSDCVGPHGYKKLHEFLQSVYQTEFDNNFRIIIVQDCVDHYDYDDLPGRTLCELQKSASKIDISNFFVLVVSGNKDLPNELTQVQKLYSSDECSMQAYVIEDIEYDKVINQYDTFCVLPWTHLYVGTDGNFLPCCQSDHQFPLGNIQDHAIDEVYKSDRLKTLRRKMLSNQRVKECASCYRQEDLGLQSSRIKHNLRWNSVVSRHSLDPSGSITSFKPRYLDIRLNNTCNLKCRMCSGYFSSAIAQEESDLFGSRISIDTSLHGRQRKQNLEKILAYVPHAEQIYFAGGEPLLSSEHYDILKKLINCGNTDLGINYNTNFTTLQYRDINVLDLWKQFSNITIGASLDAQGPVAEYVRHGTSWHIIETNLDLLTHHCPHVKFTVTSSVGVLNVQSLVELQRSWHNQHKLNISKFSLNLIFEPAHLTLTVLPEQHKQRLDIMLKNHIAWCIQNGANRLAEQWQNVLTYMWSNDSSHQLGEFRRLTRLIDHHRGEDLTKSIPELQDIL